MTVPQKDIVLNDTSDYVFQSTRIQRRHIHVVTIFELLQNVDLCVLKKKERNNFYATYILCQSVG